MNDRKILYIFQNDFPWDVRAEKFLLTLSKKYVVHLACRNIRQSEKAELWNNISIHRFPYNLCSIFSEPVPGNILWKRFLNSIIVRHKPDILIVRDLPLALTVIALAKRHNIPVIFDMAENYPEFFITFKKYKKWYFQLVNSYKLSCVLEKYACKNVDSIITVVEESTERIRKNYGEHLLVSEIYNYPALKGKIKLLKRENETIVKIVYFGGLDDDNLRGVSDAIRAMGYVDDSFRLDIIGEGDSVPFLQQLAQELKILNRVNFLKKVEYNNLLNIVGCYDIGVITHRKNYMTDTTMANKIYEYLHFGLCVITSDCVPLQRFVTQHHVGMVYKSGNVRDLANKLLAVQDTDLLSQKEREYRYKIANEQFDWEEQEENLFRIVEKCM